MVGSEEAFLVERVKEGDRSAFDQLVLRCQGRVFAVALRMLGDRDEAEEVTQDAFVHAYRTLGTFRGEAKVSTWLVSIVINLCRNRRRWWARRRQRIVASLEEPMDAGEGTMGQMLADPAPTPAQVAQQREVQQVLLEGLQMLDDNFRTVIVLRDIEGYSYEEIARALRCRVGTVKSRLNRARLQLRAILDGRF